MAGAAALSAGSGGGGRSDRAAGGFMSGSGSRYSCSSSDDAETQQKSEINLHINCDVIDINKASYMYVKSKIGHISNATTLQPYYACKVGALEMFGNMP